ncbi:YodC family protein [Cellvibrio japonicus]|uniref:YodC family protein n=1 Tax=Cellvibrio japonicus TaxID=155077 RepID=UPI00059F6E9A|nr:DUF2158 domain-containing protein [Cellvibrio japonicus]QEI13467.1 DUF2158 domain-containing protein [Cellvibrio japonicus]QEI17041.1 DUF2158 domain-containing protein [Cellvibrio japonicus]QEI20619.1 DUF2158 domain-containing protein [Cellvibrio japonicus]
MSNKFNVGDVVILKSGGELMTVEGYSGSTPNKVLCVWSEKAKIHRDEFLEATLEEYDTAMPFSV